VNIAVTRVLTYIGKIYTTRYFWWNLALSDLRSKFRRSVLGMSWAILQPLALTLLFTFVLGRIFAVDMADYAPYVFSGIIVWEFIVSSANIGCHALLMADGYIKQCTHPLAIYSLRIVCVALINLLLAFAGFLVWVIIVKPENIGWTWLSLLFSFPIIILVVWPLAILTSFIGTRFRDFSQLIVIGMQAVWYVSPVFFQADMFRKAKIEFLVDYNPVYHLLNLIRMPTLHGQFPDLINIIFAVGTAGILWLLASLLIAKQERQMIFYL